MWSVIEVPLLFTRVCILHFYCLFIFCIFLCNSFISHKINRIQNVSFTSYTLMRVKINAKVCITKLQTMDKNYFDQDIHSQLWVWNRREKLNRNYLSLYKPRKITAYFRYSNGHCALHGSGDTCMSVCKWNLDEWHKQETIIYIA